MPVELVQVLFYALYLLRHVCLRYIHCIQVHYTVYQSFEIGSLTKITIQAIERAQVMVYV